MNHELLEAMVLLNSWARGNGREYAGTIYAVKERFLAHYADRGWRFRTSVIVRCRTCGGYERCFKRSGLGVTYGECWDCNGTGKVTLHFVVTELPGCEGYVATFHTPRHLARLTEDEFGKLQMVPPGDWQPNQPGKDLEPAVGLSLLLHFQSRLNALREVA